MATSTFDPTTKSNYTSDEDSSSPTGGRRALASKTAPTTSSLPNLPSSDGLRAPAGSLLKGATDDQGQLKNAGLMVGIKLDLEAEVHLTARVRGDIVIGLY